MKWPFKFWRPLNVQHYTFASATSAFSEGLYLTRGTTNDVEQHFSRRWPFSFCRLFSTYDGVSLLFIEDCCHPRWIFPLDLVQKWDMFFLRFLLQHPPRCKQSQYLLSLVRFSSMGPHTCVCTVLCLDFQSKRSPREILSLLLLIWVSTPTFRAAKRVTLDLHNSCS